MTPKTPLLAATLALLPLLAACENKTPAPPVTSTSGSGINNLSSNPTSIPGKSAKMAKDTVAKVQGAQDTAANAANQITGQSSSEVVVGGLKFAVPEGWKSTQPSSTFTAASYLIPAAGAQCNFSTAGGDVDSNIKRWQGQLADDAGQPVQGEIIQEQVAGLRVTIFKASGSYSGMGGTKQANTAFRGAIVQTPSQSVFVKMTGPADKIGSADAAWDAMVKGFTQ
jgi:outer membrane murein-binding lipoprotein Lpp